MTSLLLITEALEYIEDNLTQDLKTEDIARNLHCSKSSIEKLFRIVTHMSIKDYSIRRRMTRAARDLREDPNVTLLELAVKYGYSSNEAFTRAFRGIWHTNPSEYRSNPTHFELFPAFKFDRELLEDERMSQRKKVDISEIYDYIKDRHGCYFIGTDIKGLVPINNISYEAGDIAILTAMQRLEQAAGEDDIVFRIGGDEFVVLTSSKDKKYADRIIAKILSHNEETFRCNGQDIPLSLYATGYTIENKNIRYSELFSQLQNQMDCAKWVGKENNTP